MGFDDGQIILDSENGAYYAGQTVRGRMVFTQGKMKTIHGIYVDMKGFCKVHWTTSHTRRVNDRTEHYTVHHDSHEEYFRSKHFMFGSENGEHHLKPGQHDFRFEFHIPPDVPSTFEGSYGHIRYRVKVVMVTSGIFSMNKDKWVPIKVHAPLDLNESRMCREPMEFDLSSSYCCWCMNAGFSEIMVRMPVSGYCPGQLIPMEVSCQNDSNVEIEEIKFAIKKDVTYTAAYEPDTRRDHDTVAEITKGPIPGRTTRNWTVEMEVPAMDMYNVNACRYIDIEYHFKISTEVSGCHNGTEETRPIIFGTIPLVGFQDTVQNPLHDQLPQIQVNPTTSSYPPAPVINQPYPSNGYPSNTPYPGGAPGFPTTPNLGGRTSPYPQGQPYPNASPYPGVAQPYPGVAAPYPPGTSPYPGPNPPYPGGNSPYPPASSPFAPEKSPHGSNQNILPPYPGGPMQPLPQVTPLKTGTIGFGVAEGDGTKIPLLPAGAAVPYPTSPASNPYAASAPEPSTPGNDEQKVPLDDTSEPPPYNPEFMPRPHDMGDKQKTEEKKDDKKEEKKDEKETK
ncbi:hypothetical protein PYW07_002969 [Mythimna separata]|uniref:Arrestin C-terminal-like domain-containing protein n=1 Tax=Mythimna separata TaxID=271217 RepID=A0AAD8DQD6_MYTSE|nr:hypothetical protein PYW07_002969 [Mythimna separata]